MGKRPPAPPPAAPAAPFHSPFARLAEERPDVVAAARPPSPSPPPPPSAGKPPKPPPARAVVRIERKGRGGKEATVIEKLGLPPKELATWADALKRSLGCGGAVEGDAIAVQGDQRERVTRWLAAKGIGKIVAG